VSERLRFGEELCRRSPGRAPGVASTLAVPYRKGRDSDAVANQTSRESRRRWAARVSVVQEASNDRRYLANHRRDGELAIFGARARSSSASSAAVTTREGWTRDGGAERIAPKAVLPSPDLRVTMARRRFRVA
jgi:hypothetical protein